MKRVRVSSHPLCRQYPMKIGVPKEIKTAEARVALTPAGAEILAKAGHQVTVESMPVTAVVLSMTTIRKLGLS